MTNYKRIGLVLPAIPGYSETFFKNKIEGLVSNGFEVILFINGSGKKTLYQNKIPVIFLSSLSKNKLVASLQSLLILVNLLFFHFSKVKAFFSLEKSDGRSTGSILKSLILNKAILKTNLDWVHFGFGTMSLGRENVGDAIGAKMAVSFRGFDYYVYPVKNDNCYKILFSKKVKYHVLSENMKIGLLNKGIREENIVKITPAIDLSLFKTDGISKSKSDTINILTVARLHWIKGLEYTLEALSILNQKGLKFRYTIIGDGAEKERLQFLVYQLKLENCVFFKGKLSHQEIKGALENTDLYLQYSIQEGFCNAVLEAQAMGKICVVSDADGLIENVIDNVTGFVVAKRKPLSLAKKIEDVLSLPEVRKNEISHNAIQRVEQYFSVKNQIDKFLDFYEKY